MVDVSGKKITKRIARAAATITLPAKAFAAFTTSGSPKGDIFETAKIAGMMAAKNTSQLIPMCHPLELSSVKMNFEVDRARRQIRVTSEVTCLGRTGVEMEALTSVAVAALTIYDMMKWADQGMGISDIKLFYKSGGKSGTYQR